MLLEDFMENFVERFKAVEEALEAAREELNSVGLPQGIGPLRLSRHEIGNIVLSVAGLPGRETPGDPRDEQLVAEGLDELAEQLYLHQFADTLREVCASFHRDMVSVLRHNPLMMGSLSPIVSQLKTETSSALQRSRKFETLRQMADECIERWSDEAPDYVLRILDELADFADAMTLPMGDDPKGAPPADNDNRAPAV